MTEAEVLSLSGSPTREEEGEVKSRGTVSGGSVSGFLDPAGDFSGTMSGGSFKGETIAVKRYYYMGDRSKAEQTRVITFEKGRSLITKVSILNPKSRDRRWFARDGESHRERRRKPT